jgi:ATP-binding cassette, subfamily B, multidrug efflux pump
VSEPKPDARRGTAAEAERVFHEEDALGKTYDAQLLKRLWPFVRTYRWQLALAMLLLPVGSELLVAQPRMMRSIIDDGVGHGDVGAVHRGSVALAVLIVAEFGVRFTSGYLLQIVGQRSMADVRREVFRFLQAQRIAFFDRQPIGRLTTRVTNDVDAVGELFASGAVTAVGDVITLTRIVVAMVVLSPQLSLLTFLAVPPLAWLVDRFRRRARDAFRAIRTKTARMNAYLNEQVTGVAVVQAFAQERRCQDEFGEINSAYREANQLAIRYDAMLYAVVDAFASVCIASLLFAGAWALHRQQPAASLGVLVAFVQYVQRFFEPLREISSKFTILQNAMSGAERVFGLLDKPEPDAPTAEVPARGGRPPPEGTVAFEAVRFGYKPGQPTLRGVSFAVPRGRTLAIVGPTGAGKTSIISLLQRLYEVDEGAVFLDGVDIRTLPKETLRRRVVVVPQDVVLFPGDVLANVAPGEASPDEARAEEIARRLGLLDLLTRRGIGLRSSVGERGGNFSSGERQLIALARALYREPEVLVLDEATASLDSETEATVQSAVAETLRGRTAIVIAHRLSTIRHADEILVMLRGDVAERGTHAELMAQGGVYAKLHRLQFVTEPLAVPAAP